MSGWIKLSRDIKKHWIWQDKTYRCWWLDLLMEAAWAPYVKIIDRKTVTIEVGQLEASFTFLGEKWGVDKRTAKKFIRLLEEQGMVTHTVYHKYAILTICNFDKYQGADEKECTPECMSDSTTQSTGQCTTECTPQCTQIKEDKEDKEYINTFSNEKVSMRGAHQPSGDESQVDWEEEKENLRKLEKLPKPRAKKVSSTLQSKARDLFEAHYKNLYGESYYWTAKDAGNMKQLLNKIKFSREQRENPLPVDDDSLLDALEKFLNVINKSWVMDNFSVSNINSQYNCIVSEVKNKSVNNSQTASRSRANINPSVSPRKVNEQWEGIELPKI